MGSQTQVFFELRTHLLKSNYYQAVSIIFSIFRTMDLYQFTKYESISERIKRLASPSSLPSPPLPLQTAIKMRPFQSPPPTIPQKIQDQKLFRVNIPEKTAPSRAPTQETDRNLDQQSQTLINELMSTRDYSSSKPQNREIKFAFTEEDAQQSSPLQKYQQKRVIDMKKQPQQYQCNPPKSSQLSKVKSESTLKLDQILQSYNNYKQSKQQFMSQLQQNKEQHQRVVSQNLKQLFDKENDPDLTSPRESEYRMSHIDSLWNEVSGSKESIKEEGQKIESKQNLPTFKRSHKKGNFEELKKVRDSEVIQNHQKPAAHRRSLSKLIVRNSKAEKEPKQSYQPILTMALSPRGSRVPGKICKNVDRSTMLPPRWVE